MYDFKEFFEENKSYCLAFIVVFVLGISAVWLLCDHYRNEPIYNNTDQSMADLEKRINSVESRVNILSKRITHAEKTVSGIADRVKSSTEYAHQIAAGIDGIEKRIDDAIQRSGRIQNLITDIENANKQREKNP